MTARPLALSMGEAAGIGAEITARAWHDRVRHDLHPFIYVGPPGLVQEGARACNLDVPVREIDCTESALRTWNEALPVLPLELARPVCMGEPHGDNAQTTIDAIRMAVELVTRGDAAAIVTNPIHKATLYGAGFTFPGHTEYLAELAGVPGRSVMMLVTGTLRTVPVTVHVSLKSAIDMLSADLIFATGMTACRALERYFGVAGPRLAVSGLNPHAGESGALGDEEAKIILPAIKRLIQEGIDVTGPLPADSMFHAPARRTYDAALCMYHDQALIPIKTLGFEHGVNCTLGLPFIRTSPDHGTALGIAGSGTADPSSLIAALNLAGTMARNADGR